MSAGTAKSSLSNSFFSAPLADVDPELARNAVADLDSDPTERITKQEKLIRHT